MTDDAISRLAASLNPVESGRPDGIAPWQHLRAAAVLVLLFPGDDGPNFVLTVRRDTLTHHPGQVSLPGGRLDSDDASGWEAALREAREELGMRTGRLRPLGRLDPVPTVVSNHVIFPYVGWSPVRPRLRPSEDEVAAVTNVPLAALLDMKNVREEIWELRGAPYVVTYYWLAGLKVWGATARVLDTLAGHLGGVSPKHPPGSVRAP